MFTNTGYPRKDVPNQGVSMPNPVVHFEIVGKDGAKLQQFYRDAFDWAIDADNPMAYGLVDAQGDGIGGGVGQAMGPEPYVTLYIQVDDMRAGLDRVKSLGGEIVVDITTIPGMVTFAHFPVFDGEC